MFGLTVIEELALIAFSDMSDCFGAQNSSLELSQIAPEKRRAISSIRINKNMTKTHMHYQLNYKMHDKVKALQMLGKMLGLNKYREPSVQELLRREKEREEERRRKGNG